MALLTVSEDLQMGWVQPMRQASHLPTFAGFFLALCLISLVIPHALCFPLRDTGPSASREGVMMLSKPCVSSLVLGNCCRGSRSEAGWKTPSTFVVELPKPV